MDTMQFLPIGSVIAYAGNLDYLSDDWLPCDGRLVPSDCIELMNRIGKSTPNLSGRTILGSGPGKTNGETYVINDSGGSETHTLTKEEMPKHRHNYTYKNPLGQHTSKNLYSGSYWEPSTVNSVTDDQGGDKPHNNMMPYYVLHFIIKAK